MQVFQSGGGAGWATILAAMEDCVRLEVDTVNLSLGAAAGFTDVPTMMETMNKFLESDIQIIIAAGNDTNNAYGNRWGMNMSLLPNPDTGLVGTPSTYNAAISVASVDNDGAQYIISQLAKVASCMGKTRDEQFKRLLQVSSSKIKSVMEGYFVSTDLDQLLQANIRKARAISREMAFTCNSDNYYFGHLLQALQLTESVCYREVHSVMQGPEINSKVNDFKDYEIIRNHCKNFGYPIEEAKTTDDKWLCLINSFAFISREEAEEYLIRKKVDVNKLFDGSFKRKLNSCIIGDAIFDKWCSRIKSVDFLNEFSNEDSFDTNIMTMLVEELILTANSLNLRDIMAEAIAEYVNVVNIHTANETLLADLLASIINDFVMDFGFKYLSDEEKNKAKGVCEKSNIPAFKYICKKTPETLEEEELTAMFNEMFENPQALLPSFDDNYNKWIEYMFVSFVAHLDIPEYDHDANEALAKILEHINEA